MYFPEFLQNGDVIGVCAPSAGVGRKLELYQSSIDTLISLGYCVQETDSVRNNNIRSNDAKIRAKELNVLFLDKDVKFVMAAAGGDFLFECLPYVDWNILKKNPKWLMGASDPTSLLFTYTTKYDVATFYGCNAGSYDARPLYKYLKNNLEMISGNLIEQKSFSKCMKEPAFMVDEIKMNSKVYWKSNKDSFTKTGRCIGGCIDVLKDIIGTEYDNTKQFIKKYKDDGIIWYFDNFSMSAENFYRSLLQMKYAGWFEHTKAVLVGRVLFESSETGMTYKEALERALGNIPYVYEADIGHTMPSMTMINGSLLKIKYAKGKASLSFTLKK